MIASPAEIASNWPWLSILISILIMLAASGADLPRLGAPDTGVHPLSMRLVGLVHRLARCPIQRRVWLREARRTWRRLVVSDPCTDPLKRCEECCKYSEYHCGGEKHEG